MYTIDANVFARDADPYDTEHATCNALLEKIESSGVQIIVPLIVQAEVASAVARRFLDPIRGRLYLDSVLLDFKKIRFIPIDPPLARDAALIAADYGLRGMDAIYAAVARRHACTLVTLDDELHRRAAVIVTTRTPAEALAELSPSAD